MNPFLMVGAVALLLIQALLMTVLFRAIASARGITRGTEVMSRTIVETCREIQCEVHAIHTDVLAFGARLTEVEGQVEAIVQQVNTIERHTLPLLRG